MFNIEMIANLPQFIASLDRPNAILTIFIFILLDDPPTKYFNVFVFNIVQEQ